MKTALRLAAAAALAASSIACIGADVLIKVKGDGSGTVEKTLTMNPSTLAEMGGLKGGKDPTKLTDAMSGCSRIRSTATLSPWTTLNTPSGTPASASSSPR